MSLFFVTAHRLAAWLTLAGLLLAGPCAAQTADGPRGQQVPAPEPRKERNETPKSGGAGAAAAVGAVGVAALLVQAARNDKRIRELQAELDAALKARDDARRALNDERAAGPVHRAKADELVQARTLELDRERKARQAAEQEARAARATLDNLQTQLNQARAEVGTLNTRVRQAQATATSAAGEARRERELRSAAEAGAAGATQRVEQLQHAVTAALAQRGWWAGAAGAIGLALGGMLVRAVWPKKLRVEIPVETAVLTPLTVQVSAGAWSIDASALPREAHPGFALRTAWLPIASSVRPARSLVREVLRGPTRSAFT